MRDKLNYRYKRGDVIIVNLGKGKGSEQHGIRPCIVVSNDIGNNRSGIVTVAIATSKNKKNIPTHTYIEKSFYSGLTEKTTVLTEQLRTVSKERIIRRAGKLSKKEIKEIDTALKVSLNI